LLYIGKAQRQTFSKRIKQREWETNYDMQSNVAVYVGRLAGNNTPLDNVWDKQITFAEKLLIRSHMPALNQQLFFPEKEHKQLSKIHIINWEERRLLLPEVSGAFWTDKFWSDIDKKHIYGAENLKRTIKTIKDEGRH
jgi:hypothetical protein